MKVSIVLLVAVCAIGAYGTYLPSQVSVPVESNLKPPVVSYKKGDRKGSDSHEKGNNKDGSKHVKSNSGHKGKDSDSSEEKRHHSYGAKDNGHHGSKIGESGKGYNDNKSNKESDNNKSRKGNEYIIRKVVGDKGGESDKHHAGYRHNKDSGENKSGKENGYVIRKVIEVNKLVDSDKHNAGYRHNKDSDEKKSEKRYIIRKVIGSNKGGDSDDKKTEKGYTGHRNNKGDSNERSVNHKKSTEYGKVIEVSGNYVPPSKGAETVEKGVWLGQIAGKTGNNPVAPPKY